MPNHRFEVHQGHHSVDPETVDLPDMVAAQREGIRHAGATLVLDARKFLFQDGWRMDVTDQAGTLLYRLDFAMTMAPAAER